jgi:hypothetical protein
MTQADLAKEALFPRSNRPKAWSAGDAQEIAQALTIKIDDLVP